MSRAGDTERLRAIRARLDALAGDEWFMAADGETFVLESRDAFGTLTKIATFDARAERARDVVVEAVDDLRFMVGLVDRAIEALKRRPANEREPPAAQDPQTSDEKNYAAECGMRCQDAGFIAFLRDRYLLASDDPDAVAVTVRRILGVRSRKELNQGGKPAQAWRRLRSEFADYQKTERDKAA